MAGFLQALGVTLEQEGGLVDHPADRGGRTNYGVTTAVWRAWLEATGQEFRPVDEITPDEARAVYHERYWLRASCDAFPWPLSLVLFDMAVHHGPKNAIRILQRGLGSPTTGSWGR